MSVLAAPLEPSTLVVAIDPGKVSNRVWLSDGSGLVLEPVTVPVSGQGVTGLEHLMALHQEGHTGLLIAIEATGSLHRAWSAAMEQRHPGAVRLFAPSEPRRRARNWGRAGSRPMIGTVPR